MTNESITTNTPMWTFTNVYHIQHPLMLTILSSPPMNMKKWTIGVKWRSIQMPSHGPIILINQIENNHFLLLAFSEDHKILSMFIYVPKLSFTPFENYSWFKKLMQWSFYYCEWRCFEYLKKQPQLTDKVAPKKIVKKKLKF